MKNPSHTVLLSISVISMVLVAALYVFMQYSIQISISRSILGNQIIQIEKMNIDQEKSLMAMYSSTTENRKKILSLFIPFTKAVSLIESIEKLGSYTGSEVSISSVSSDNIDSAMPGSFSKIDAHVEVVGSWVAVLRTLRLSETLPYQVSLSNIRLSSSGLSDNGDGKRSWRLLFDLTSNMIVTK